MLPELNQIGLWMWNGMWEYVFLCSSCSMYVTYKNFHVKLKKPVEESRWWTVHNCDIHWSFSDIQVGNG